MAVITIDELKAMRNSTKACIVWTNGCFDIIHAGHISFLKEACRMGDILVVGLNSDRSMKKIKRAPINKQDDRAKVMSAIRYVDHVVIFNDLEPSRMVEMLKPDICCKAGDWKGKEVPEKKVVEDYGGTFKLIPYKEGYSTTKVIKKCKKA